MLVPILILLAAVLAVFAAAAFYALLKGCFELRRNLRAASHDLSSLLLKSPIVPGVSVVFAAADASSESRSVVRRLLDLHFGRHELVLVLDGPPNAELERWIEEFHLFRQERTVPQDLPAGAVHGYYLSRDPVRLLVVVKHSGGLADAMNAGVNAAQYPVIGLVDREADFIPEVLLRMIRPMLADSEHVVAVCGVAPPPPAPGLAGCIGAIEALRLWLARCAAFSAWNILLPAPGACMLVKREAICRVKGFRAGPLELFVDLHMASRAESLAWRFAFVAAPVSFRPAAGTWDDLRRQLRRRSATTGGGFGPFRYRGRQDILRAVLCPRIAAPDGNRRLLSSGRRVARGVGLPCPGGTGAGNCDRRRNDPFDGGRSAAGAGCAQRNVTGATRGDFR